MSAISELYACQAFADGDNVGSHVRRFSTATARSPPAAPAGKPEGADKKLIAGLLAILIGWTGAHKFYLGYTKEGIIMLVLFCVSGIVGIIEEVLYLTKSDEEFVDTYIKGSKPWF